MDSDTLLELGIVLATAPAWFPIARRLFASAWRAGEPEEEPVEAEPTEERPAVFSDEGDAWSHRRRVNAVWDTGRRKPRPNAFERRAG